MPSMLRTALLSSVVAVAAGCSFFTLDEPSDKNSSDAPATGGSSGTGGTDATGGTGGSIAPAGGSAGAATGGSAGTAVVGTGGSGGSSGAAAGTGNVSGTGGDSSGGGEAGAPGTGGAGPSGGSGSGTAGMGMGGTAGSGPVTCATLNAGSEAFGGHCYLAVTTTVDFNTAKNGCMALGNGAHLVTISSESPLTQSDFDAENAFVFNLGGMKECWIAASDGMSDQDQPNGTPYAWLNGEDMTLDKWRVDPMEPNNYNKNCGDGSNCWEHCGAMLAADPGPAGDWNDDLCEAKKQYVCEWDTGGS